jgi:hypothetical protein
VAQLHFSVIIDRDLLDVLALLPRFESLLPRYGGGYSFEGLDGATRITYTSQVILDPASPLHQEDTVFERHASRLAALKGLMEAA